MAAAALCKNRNPVSANMGVVLHRSTIKY